MFRLLHQLFNQFRAKQTVTPQQDFDALFAALEAEQRRYSLQHGGTNDESEAAMLLRRTELETYFERYKPTVEEMLDAIHQSNSPVSHRQLT